MNTWGKHAKHKQQHTSQRVNKHNKKQEHTFKTNKQKPTHGNHPPPKKTRLNQTITDTNTWGTESDDGIKQKQTQNRPKTKQTTREEHATHRHTTKDNTIKHAYKTNKTWRGKPPTTNNKKNIIQANKQTPTHRDFNKHNPHLNQTNKDQHMGKHRYKQTKQSEFKSTSKNSTCGNTEAKHIKQNTKHKAHS